MLDTERSIDTLPPTTRTSPDAPAAPARRVWLREASGLAALATVAGIAGVAATPAFAQGAGYLTLESPLGTRDPSRMEVLEFFWFGCPHCFRFEPTINAWAASRPDDVDFVREAPPLNPGWETHSRTFYAAEALGITDGMFDRTFHRIHDEGDSLRKPAAVGAFIASLDLGTDADTFVSTMRSFSVETALRRSVRLASDAGVTGVPSLLINGTYLTSASIAGGNDGMIRVVDDLIVRERG